MKRVKTRAVALVAKKAKAKPVFHNSRMLKALYEDAARLGVSLGAVGDQYKLWLEALFAERVPRSETTILKSLDALEDKEYTVSIPITLHLQEWFYLRMAAAGNRCSMAEFIQSLCMGDGGSADTVSNNAIKGAT